jgi:hypothetical protein
MVQSSSKSTVAVPTGVAGTIEPVDGEAGLNILVPSE